MKPYSVTRRLITTVLLLELLSAVAFTWLAVEYERHARFSSFDVSLRARAAMLFGAIGDADDPGDNVVLDLRGLQIPPTDLFDVEGLKGKVLGRSAFWPAQQINAQLGSNAADGIYSLTLDGREFRFVVLHATRVVDPTENGGGVRRPVFILYGASANQVWSEIWEAVRFYAVASLVLLATSGIAMTGFLRRSLSPLGELAAEASKISAQQWQFHPRDSARAMIELAPLTEALESAVKRLQRSFEQQRRFTSDAAHELKTDLATAKSSLQLLAMRKRTLEEYGRGLEVCLTDILRIEDTVAKMLTLARVEYAYDRAGVHSGSGSDLTLLLQEGITQLESLAELKQVVVRINSPQRILVAISEQDSRLLCINLLLNALQHSLPRTEVKTEVMKSDGWVRLRIVDQGTGIPAEALPHIFEPFFRQDSSRDRRSGGTGLGLAICKGICERAGGVISIRSELGQGTEVSVRLPA